MGQHKQKWPRLCRMCGRSSASATADEVKEHERTCTGPPTPREMEREMEGRVILTDGDTATARAVAAILASRGLT